VFVTSVSPISMRPDVGSIRRLIIRSVVVFPHPEGPTRVTIDPEGTSRLSPVTASPSVPGKRFVTSTRRMELEVPMASTVDVGRRRPHGRDVARAGGNGRLPRKTVSMTDEASTDADLPTTEEEWRARLTPEQYAVLRQAGTEPAGSGALLDEHGEGVFACGACGAELFESGTKFESGSGWPSFFDVISPDRVELVEDRSHGMVRVEVRCGRCHSHLGHLFPDGPAPTGQRYCMNSLALEFEPAEG